MGLVMRNWNLERLEEFEKQVNVIIAEEQREQDELAAQRIAQAAYRTYQSDSQRNPQGYDGPTDYGVNYAKYEQKYKDAIQVIKTDFKYEVEEAKANLNAARKILVEKYRTSDSIKKAEQVIHSLSAAGEKPYDDPATFQYLMENVNILNQATKDALLVKAVEMKNADAVNKLADAKAKITDQDLKVVIKNEWCKDAGLKKLIQRAQSVSGETVGVAVANGVSEDVLKKLASKVKDGYKELRPALIQSVDKNNNAAAKVLLKAGVNPSPIHDRDGNSLLVIAIREGNEDLIENLIKATNLDYKDWVINGIYNDADKRDRQSALQAAIQVGRLDIAQTLIDNGANVNFINRAGETALNTAVSKGNVEAAQFLLLNGASIHIGDQKKLNADIAKNPEIKVIFDVYRAVELDFQESFVPQMNKMIEDMKYMEDGLTSYNVMQKFDEMLKAAYGTDKSFEGSFAKNGLVSSGKFAKEFRLGFVEEALMTIQSAFESIFSEQTYQQLKFGKMAEAIYDKIKDTQKFQALAAPNVGKVTGVVLEELDKIAKVDINPKNDMGLSGYVDTFKDALSRSKQGTREDKVRDAAEAVTEVIVNSVAKNMGIELNDAVGAPIKDAISGQLSNILSKVESADLDNTIEICLKSAVSDATNKVSAAVKENALQNAEDKVEEKTGLREVLGKHTAKVLGVGNNAPAQGTDVTRS